MIQQSLVDYIVSQSKAGISRDTIKSALIGVGWQVADVEDSLLKADADMKPAVAPMTSPIAAATPITASPSFTAKPLSSASSPASQPIVAKPLAAMNPFPARPATVSSSFSPMDIVGTGSASVGAKGPAMQQPSHVTDFMSRMATPASTVPSNMASRIDKVFPGNAAARPAVSPVAMASASRPVHHVDGEKVGMIAEAIGLVALAALTIYFYTQNHALSMQLNTGTSTSANTSATAATLQSQVQTLTTQNATLQSQNQAASQQLADLTTQIMFLAAPTNVAPGTMASGTVTGSLIGPVGVKGLYSIRTQAGVVVFVKNSNDPLVGPILKPLVSTNVVLAGSFIPGTDSIAVVTVNGQPVSAPVTTTSVNGATSTATSTSSGTVPTGMQ